tara:strand:+ start:10 stop:381 length:372 start_codon:yes stop_codon:yes gene_type:complete
MMRWTDSAKQFLGALASQDILLIQPMLHDKVKLTSWSCDVSGKHETMIALQNFFDFVDDIRIQIINTAYHNKYVCMECEMYYKTVNVEKSQIKVSPIVYILEFDDWNKIKLIRLYRMKEGVKS